MVWAGKMGRAGPKLAQKQPETANCEANGHQTQPGTNPGEKGSLGGEVHPRALVLFAGLSNKRGNCILASSEIDNS